MYDNKCLSYSFAPEESSKGGKTSQNKHIINEEILVGP